MECFLAFYFEQLSYLTPDGNIFSTAYLTLSTAKSIIRKYFVMEHKEFFTMKITVNEKPRECDRDCSIEDLLSKIGAVPDRVAIVLNDDVLSPKRIPYVVLKEGDRVEILTLAAGG